MTHFTEKLPRLHPRSFPGLVLIGLLLVMLPLVLPAALSAVSINRLSQQSQQAVLQARQINYSGRVLVDQATTMERNVKLSMILTDTSLLQRYRQEHEKFRNALQNLYALPLGSGQLQRLKIVDDVEAELSGKIIAPADKSLTRMNADFAPLKQAIDSFLSYGDAISEHEVEAMQAEADRASHRVGWVLAGMVSCALLLAFGFAALIARPIRQIDEAIRAMGDGSLTGDIRINGPQDIQQLGERLNWMRQRLLEIDNQKTAFIRHVSHELKTPLTSIREGANLLSEGIAGELTDEQCEIAQILSSNSIQLQKRIEDLLSFSELQAGKAILVMREVALRPIIERVVDDQRLAIAGKSVVVEVLCPDVSLRCDEQKVRIIVDNLLSNALKYSPRAGRVRIAAERAGDKVKLEVTDSGAGVDPLDRERIFDAFYQGRRAPQGPTRGTGLGLAIAREYALAHGGGIELVEGGEGTCFRVTLPLNKDISET